MPHVELTDLSKTFGSFQALQDISLHIEKGEFCALLGPSGCGKSTLLRLIAGLEDATTGTISINGRDVTDLEPADRRIAMVFQSYALYPHMTVAENIAFSLESAGMRKADRLARATEIARTLQLDHLLDRKPALLSGGQRQRVAIGRALVRNPEVFLFDEPLSNLDALLRVQMRLELAKLHNELKTTMIYVTHDQVEAMTLADKIVVLDKGQISQQGSPLDLYNAPANRFVASFIGSPAMNFLPAKISHAGGQLTARFATGTQLTIAAPAARAFDGEQQAELGLRPEHLGLTDVAGAILTGTASVVERLGNTSYVYLDTQLGPVIVEAAQQVNLQPGEKVGLAFDPQHAHVFGQDGKAWAVRG